VIHDLNRAVQTRLTFQDVRSAYVGSGRELKVILSLGHLYRKIEVLVDRLGVGDALTVVLTVTGPGCALSAHLLPTGLDWVSLSIRRGEVPQNEDRLLAEDESVDGFPPPSNTTDMSWSPRLTGSTCLSL